MTLTAGYLDTTRAHVAQALATALARHGLAVRLIETTSTEEALEQVDAGAIDFALVSGSYRIERNPRLRLVTPLYVEAMHLLVKEGIADGVTRSLDALRGRSIDLGVPGSTTNALARAILEFAGVEPAGRSSRASTADSRHRSCSRSSAVATSRRCRTRSSCWRRCRRRWRSR